MANPIPNMLVVGISGRALFDLDEEHQVYKTQGLDAYKKLQRERENVPLRPGTGFHLVKGLLSINARLEDRAVEVIVISRNDGDTGLRIMNSVQAHGLDISRGSFCGGRNADRYFRVYGCKLFLSAEEEDVRNVIQNGDAAALVFPPPVNYQYDSNQVRIAFDADAVLFSDEAEQFYQEHELKEYLENEAANANVPLGPGPFKPFVQAIAEIQSRFKIEECPIRTAVVTARNAPAHERAIRTLRTWGITFDEMHFLGGVAKSGILEVFQPNIFFDDQQSHIASCCEKVPAAQVPYGVGARKPVQKVTIAEKISKPQK